MLPSLKSERAIVPDKLVVVLDTNVLLKSFLNQSRKL